MDVHEPSLPGTQKGGRRESLVVVVEADDLAAIADVDVLVEVTSARWILEVCVAALAVAQEVANDPVAALVGAQDLVTIVDTRGRGPRLLDRGGGDGRGLRVIDRRDDAAVDREAVAGVAGRRRRGVGRGRRRTDHQ
jgi:hypothetical protein